MVNYYELQKTIGETERFLEKLKDYEKYGDAWGSPESAAASRASMDLTKQLARFRGTAVRRD
ncbi:MAG: hypothetical protein M0R51_11280 [Clostridia bacterium]|jgi:hypothetical protein|nr:hypothetical protein [Clostridia bacterium]